MSLKSVCNYMLYAVEAELSEVPIYRVSKYLRSLGQLIKTISTYACALPTQYVSNFTYE